MNREDQALLDEFADTVLWSVADSTILPPEDLADYCYEVAGAMLNARRRKIEQRDFVDTLDHGAIWGGPAATNNDPFGLGVGPLNLDPYGKHPDVAHTEPEFNGVGDAKCCGQDCGSCDGDIFQAMDALGSNVITISGPEATAEFLAGLEACETDEDMAEFLQSIILKNQH